MRSNSTAGVRARQLLVQCLVQTALFVPMVSGCLAVNGISLNREHCLPSSLSCATCLLMSAHPADTVQGFSMTMVPSVVFVHCVREYNLSAASTVQH